MKPGSAKRVRRRSQPNVCERDNFERDMQAEGLIDLVLAFLDRMETDAAFRERCRRALARVPVLGGLVGKP